MILRPIHTRRTFDAFIPLVLILLAVGCAAGPRPRAVSLVPEPGAEPTARSMFLPQPLADDWSQWILGEWEGSGESDAGKGRGTARFDLDLGGQFLICRGQAQIIELSPEYLKKHLHASDEEIERFQRSGYQALEVYTFDQQTGEVVGFLFDSLRCIAQGRGKREQYKETIEWQWHTGHKSTRITERLGDDKLVVIERTRGPNGSMMEDRGEMTRTKRHTDP